LSGQPGQKPKEITVFHHHLHGKIGFKPKQNREYPSKTKINPIKFEKTQGTINKNGHRDNAESKK